MALPSLSRLSLHPTTVPTDARWGDRRPHDYPKFRDLDPNDSCPICLDDLHEQNDALGPPVRVCDLRDVGEGRTEGGHVLHRACYDAVRAQGSNRCSECRHQMRVPRAPPVEERVDGRLVRETYQNGMVMEYEGDQGEEHLVRTIHFGGTVAHYEGPKGRERHVSTHFVSGLRAFFEGPHGQEHMVRQERVNGDVVHYEGRSGQVHKVRLVNSRGTTFFEGPQGLERKVRTEFNNGIVRYFEGPGGAELRVKETSPDGETRLYREDDSRMYMRTTSNGVYYYNGSAAREYPVKWVSEDGTTHHFAGGTDGIPLRLYSVEFNDGDKAFYKGPLNEEIITRHEFANGNVNYYDEKDGKPQLRDKWFRSGFWEFYEGDPGEERITRRLLNKGKRVEHYEGEKGEEHLVFAKEDGHEYYFKGRAGREFMYEALSASGNRFFYEGSKDQEYKWKTVFANGEKWYYEGRKNQEHVVQKIYPDGTVKNYEGPKNEEVETEV